MATRIEVLGVPVVLERRRYSNKTFTWASIVKPDGDWDSLGDPWPCLNPPKKQLEEAVQRWKDENPPIKTETTYTDAPDRYDGFGTRTVRIIGTMTCGSHAGQPVREVQTPAEHVQWQRLRYMSGLNLACTAEDLRGNCKGLVEYHEGIEI